MRINEITDAQGQLELLRTVIDNTWTAIAQQAEQERRAEAERKAKSKLKPRGRKAVKAPYANPPPPLKKPKPLTSNTPTPDPTLANSNADNTIKPMPSLHPSYTQATPKNALNVPKDGYFGKNIGTKEKEDDGDDRHSKNGIATLKN